MHFATTKSHLMSIIKALLKNLQPHTTQFIATHTSSYYLRLNLKIDGKRAAEKSEIKFGVLCVRSHKIQLICMHVVVSKCIISL
jgi:hypothetical protein